jgi:DNA ligase-1
MLAAPIDFEVLTFPMLASVKLDGIRMVVAGTDPVAYSRSMTPLPNRWLQAWVQQRPELQDCDGELVVGDPTLPGSLSNTVSAAMSIDVQMPPFGFYVFDSIGSQRTIYRHRLMFLEALPRYRDQSKSLGQYHVVEQVLVSDMQELEAFENTALAAGYEGVMLRDPDGFYKQGRTSVSGAELLKLKRGIEEAG